MFLDYVSGFIFNVCMSDWFIIISDIEWGMIWFYCFSGWLASVYLFCIDFRCHSHPKHNSYVALHLDLLLAFVDPLVNLCDAFICFKYWGFLWCGSPPSLFFVRNILKICFICMNFIITLPSLKKLPTDALNLQSNLGEVVWALQICVVRGLICSGTPILIIHLENIKIRSLLQAKINLGWIENLMRGGNIFVL